MTTAQDSGSIPEQVEVGLMQERLARAARKLVKPAQITNTAQLDEAITTLEEALAQLDALDPDQRDDDLRQDLAEQLRAYQAKEQRLQILDETTFEVTRRLQAAEHNYQEGGTAESALNQYRDTVTYIAGQRDAAHDWDPTETATLDRLAARANGAYEAFSLDHELPTTRQEQEDVAGLIIRFVQLERKDPDYVVSYFSEGRLGSPPRRMAVSEALRNARFILGQLWVDKVDEYLQKARIALDHDPRSPRDALAWVERCERLPGRDDPDVGVTLAKAPRDEIARVRQLAQDAVSALDRAERELRLASQALEPPNRDALAARAHWRAARDHYPYAPGLDGAEQRIAEAARTEIPLLIVAARSSLEGEVWTSTGAQLERLKALLDLLPETELATERADYGNLDEAYKLIRPLVVDELPDPAAKRERLRDLQNRYRTSYWPSWAGLQEQLKRLDTLRDLDALRQEINEACQPEASAAELQLLIDSVNDVLSNPPASTSSSERKDLPGLLTRLQSWLGYANARDELAKAPKGGTSTTQSPDDLAGGQVADLKLAQEGLDSANKDSAALDAARREGLIGRLSELQKNDTLAKQSVESVEEFLETTTRPTEEELNDQREALYRRLRLPSSYRRELLELYHRVTSQLAHKYSQELTDLLAGAEPSYYDSLDIKETNRLNRALKRLAEQSGAADLLDEVLEAETASALTFARAHRTAKEVPSGMKTWGQLKDAWMTAQEKAGDDSVLADYAFRQSRVAHKYDQFAAAAASRDSGTAEAILRQLTEDALLKQDWEVWYRYGDLTFELARQKLSPDLLFTELAVSLPVAGEQLTNARRSLVHARNASQDKQPETTEAITAQRRVGPLLEASEAWIVLQRALAEYWDVLATETLTHAGCKRLLEVHDETADDLAEAKEHRELGLPDPSERHERLWRQPRGAARTKLEGQLRQLAADNILERFDTLLGLAILFPKDSTIESRLTTESAEMLNELQKLVDRTVDDYSGLEFSRRYLSRQRRSPEPEDFLELQLEDADSTKLQLAEYRETLRNLTLERFPVDPQVLAEMDLALEQWLSKLNEFRGALQNAKRLAEDGMSNPQQFHMAKYILRSGTSQSTDLTQVSDEFINANHPTYRFVLETLERDIAQREEQVQFTKDISALIEKEREAVLLALRWRDGAELTPDEQQQVGAIVATLRELSGKLRDMQEQASGDPTQLQQRLEYHLPERTGAYYKTVTAIREVIGMKLQQYDTAKKWLEQWLTPDGSVKGIISWPQVKTVIQRERDSGPVGLTTAMKACQTARGDDVQGGQTNSPLRLKQALVEVRLESMVDSLPSVGDSENFILYGVVEKLNQERLQLERMLDNQIAESDKIERNLRWRVEHFDDRWSSFSVAQASLMAARKPLFKSWQESDVWKAYLAAARAFCEICPRYRTFQDALQDVEIKTGLPTYCDD